MNSSYWHNKYEVSVTRWCRGACLCVCDKEREWVWKCAFYLHSTHNHYLIRPALCLFTILSFLHIYPTCWLRACCVLVPRTSVSQALINTRTMSLQPYGQLGEDCTAEPLTSTADQQVHRMLPTDGWSRRSKTTGWLQIACCTLRHAAAIKKCHTTHYWVAVGSIKQRKWLNIALLSV